MKISIITTVYKAEKDLPRLLDSMMAQKSPELEFFLIDNGSPDRCGEICREYAAKDSRFTVFTLQENIGYIRARNLGIQECSGDYIGFCDSDDYLEPGGYDRAVEKIADSNCDMYIGSYYLNDGEGQRQMDPPYESGIYRTPQEIDTILLQAFGGIGEKIILNGFVWKHVYRRKVLIDNNIHFLQNIMPYEDEIFNVDVIKRCRSVLCDINPIYHYVVNTASITIMLVKNFDPQQAWCRIVSLYQEKDCRRTSQIQHEAVCNEILEMIYEYVLTLCKQPICVNNMVQLFKESTERQFIRMIIRHSSKKQKMTLDFMRQCLKINALGLLLGTVRFGINMKYR